MTDEDESLLDSHEVSSVASLDRESVTSTEGQRNRRPNQKRRPRRFGGPEGGPPPAQQSQSQSSQQQQAGGDRVAARSFSEPREAKEKEATAAQPLPPRDRKSEPKERPPAPRKVNGEVRPDASAPPAVAPAAKTRPPRQEEALVNGAK